MANSFLKARGYNIGTSKFDNVALAAQLERNFKDKIILPIDVVVAQSPDDRPEALPISKVRANQMILDIGPETIRQYAQYLREAKTLIWNGPLGLIEYPRFSIGSKSLAQIFAARSRGKAYGVAGGGETIEVLDQAKVSEFIDHISMGGGAMLEFLAGKQLPGIKVLETNA